MAIEMKMTKLKMSKPRDLGMSILDISKTLIYEFWYDYIKLKYGDRVKPCYTDTDRFVINIITEDFFWKIFPMVLKDGLTHLTTMKMIKDRSQQVRIKKYLVFLKDKLGGKIIAEVVALRPKTWAYLTDDGGEKKKAKGTKVCVIKRRLMFENYKDCLFIEKTIFKKQQRFKSYDHDVYTKEINKVALSSDGNKRIQTFDKVTTFLQETPAVKVCENEMLSVLKAKETFKMLIKSVKTSCM